MAVGGTQTEIVRSGWARTSNGAARAMTIRCWTMWPVKLSSAIRSIHGDDASTSRAIPAPHDHSRRPSAADDRVHASAYTATAITAAAPIAA